MELHAHLQQWKAFVNLMFHVCKYPVDSAVHLSITQAHTQHIETPIQFSLNAARDSAVSLTVT